MYTNLSITFYSLGIMKKTTFLSGTLSVKGYNKGKEVASDLLQTYGPAKRLKVTTDIGRLKADGQSIAHIGISVVDKNGTLVYDAANEINCEVKGLGKLLGLESGDNRIHESYTVNHRKAYHGKLLSYIQSSKKNGKIKVMISSPGLGKQVINLFTGN